MKKLARSWVILSAQGLILVCLLLLSHPARGESTKIGLLAPLSGINPVWGKKQWVAAEMAADRINRRGGINGKPLQVVIKDTGGHPSASGQLVQAYRELTAKEGVLAVVGPFFSFECETLFPVSDAEKTVLISTASSKPGLSDLNRHPYAFRMTVTEDKMARAQMMRWKAVYNISRAAVLYDRTDPTAQAVANSVWPEVMAELGIERLGAGRQDMTFSQDDADFSRQVAAIARLDPDGVCISGYGKEAGRIAKEMKKQGMDLPMLGTNQSFSQVLIETGENAAEGFWTVGQFNGNDPRPSIQRYKSEFEQRCSEQFPEMNCEAGQFDATVYDTLQFLSHLMKRENIGTSPESLGIKRDRIRQGLKQLKRWRGTAGMMAFDAKGDGIRTIHILAVQDGKWQPVD